MDYNVKSNIISLMVACGIIIASLGIFIAFVNSEDARSSDINATNDGKSKTREVKYYTISDGRILENKGQTQESSGNNFSDIEVSGTVRDDDGVLDFVMKNATVQTKYREVTEENNNKEYFSYNEMTYDNSQKYRVDGAIGEDASFQGYVYYFDKDDEDDGEKKELCTYLKSDSYFEMVSCEDEKNVYTTIKTSSSVDNGSVDTIRNNAIYKFDKKSHQTKKLCDLNIHEDEVYIHDIACNEDYLYVLVAKSGELFVKVFSKDSYKEEREASVDVKDNMEEFAAKKVKEYSVRDIDNYEIINEGYDLCASDDGIVIINRLVVAEIDKNSNKHYGEKGYEDAFQAKGLEPYVNNLYKVTSYEIDKKELKFDSAYVCEADFMFDFVFYKNGVIYIFTNEKNINADLIEKILLTAVKGGNLLDKIYIPINTITNASGNKYLKYISVK